MVVSYKLFAVEQNSRTNHVGRRNGAIDCACLPSASIPRRFYFVAPIQFWDGVAAMLALSIAYWLDMPRPYWTMTSVYITSNPLTGATGSKARYRMLGKLIGAAGTIVLVPNLVSAPELLSVAIALWVGVFLYFSRIDGTPGAYVRGFLAQAPRGVAAERVESTRVLRSARDSAQGFLATGGRSSKPNRSCRHRNFCIDVGA
jgi:hypothetical protein